jgi:transglutaminase-like putative cysteine protease
MDCRGRHDETRNKNGTCERKQSRGSKRQVRLKRRAPHRGCPALQGPQMKTPFIPSLLRACRGLPRDKADTLLLMLACVLVMAPHVTHLPWWATVLCAALLAWRAWLTARGQRMPPRWVLAPISCVAMVGVFLTHGTFLGREAGVTMLVLLMAFKLLEMRARRDLFVVIFLGFFLLLTSFFYSQTIFSALLVLCAVVAILTAQLSFQFTGTVPALRKRAALAARILGLALPLTLVLFVLFPRIQGPLWGMPGAAARPHTGLSDSMSLDNISSLALSGEVAFRVKFAGEVPPKSKLYWRGPVLGDFDGKAWHALRIRRGSNLRIAMRRRSAPIRYQVTLEPTGQTSLFALDLPLLATELENNPTRLAPDLQILARNAITERVRYEAVSSVDYDLQADQPLAAMREWLALPAGQNPRTLALATDMRQRERSPDQMVQAVLRMFRVQSFRYTLSPPPLGANTIDDFLLSTRAGFCEHYASAFVVMMRMMEIPARVVTGYQGGEINPVDGYMTIRQSDAHAWAEVWLAGRGWVRVDPTAAIAPDRVEQNLESVIPPQLLGGLFTLDQQHGALSLALDHVRQNWEAINNDWNQWVLDYTPTRQRNFIQSLGFRKGDWQTLTLLMVTIGIAVMTIVALPLVRHWQKRDRVEALYAAFCENLAQLGYPRAVHEGPRAFRERLIASELPVPPVKIAAIRSFLELYEEARYAPARPGLSDRARRSTILFTELKILFAHSR